MKHGISQPHDCSFIKTGKEFFESKFVRAEESPALLQGNCS